jgi:PilZ domain
MPQTLSAYAACQDQADQDQTRLIEAWRHEFLHVAMMTAFVTMHSADARDNPTAAELEGIESTVPADPAIDRAVRQGHLEISSRYAPALFAAQSAYDNLYTATATLAVAAAQARGAATAVPPVAFVVVRQHWRSTSRSFLQAMSVFDHNGLLHLNPDSGSALKTQCPMRLMQLLRAASAGETIVSSGVGAAAGQLPEWVQRRRWDRRDVNLQCSVDSKGGFFIASIRNISHGGALLDGVLALPRGTSLRLTVGGGRRLNASVMWHRDQTMGIKFDAELLPDDVLVKALEI